MHRAEPIVHIFFFLWFSHLGIWKLWVDELCAKNNYRCVCVFSIAWGRPPGRFLAPHELFQYSDRASERLFSFSLLVILATVWERERLLPWGIWTRDACRKKKKKKERSIDVVKPARSNSIEKNEEEEEENFLTPLASSSSSSTPPLEMERDPTCCLDSRQKREEDDDRVGPWPEANQSAASLIL